MAVMLVAGAIVAGPALAKKENSQAEWYSFAYCPFAPQPESKATGVYGYSSKFPEGYTFPEGEQANACIWGQSSYKEKWISGEEEGKKVSAEEEAEKYHATHPALHSEFRAGNVTVALKLPITLRGGYQEHVVENAETEELEAVYTRWIGAEGHETIEPVAQKTIKLTKGVDTAKLSHSELNRYDFYTEEAKEKNVTATVELAGSPFGLELNENNLFDEEGVAFGFPVKVKLSNPFLGEHCYVGSDEHPVFVEFTTGQSGALHGKTGQATGNDAGLILTIHNDTLVNETFAAPGVEGCGVEGGADEAVDSALGLPSPAGSNVAIINGTFRQAGREEVEEHGVHLG
jgi:hypothetical protein